jgi:hypothetical protein
MGQPLQPCQQRRRSQSHPTMGEELVRLGCLLSVMMPYAQASEVLRQWSGLSVSAASLWNWVQQVRSAISTININIDLI